MTLDILLNPSVETIDEERLVGHIRRLFGLFKFRDKVGLPVSTLDLMDLGKAQYNARLSELRMALIPLGWCIDRVVKDLPDNTAQGVHYYKLVTLEKSTYYQKRKATLCVLRK